MVAGIYLDQIFLYLLPLAVLVGVVAIVNFKPLYYLLLFSLPLSMELEFGAGLALNVPTEPLMAGLMLVFVFYTLLNFKSEDMKFLAHPLSILSLLLIIWTAISTLYSGEVTVSLKFLLAKCWFVVSFVFLTAFCIKKTADFKIAFWCIFVPLVGVTVYTLIRHYLIGFSFELVNNTMKPFFSNHVDYAVMQVAILPFCLAARNIYSKGSVARLLIDVGSAILIVGIFYSYTRAAMGSLVIILGCYFIIKQNISKLFVVAGLFAAAIAIGLLSRQNAYLAYAPNYEKTVYAENWSKHLKATVDLKDVSSMERVYRWVAAFKMFKDHPVVGFGPGSFYYFYKQYTVSSFKTYVSENTDKSTVHNYYLLVLVEQGLIGLLVFLALVIYTIFTMQRLYNTLKTAEHKWIVMATGICFIVLLANNFLGDMVEVDKTGSLFFICIGLILGFDSRQQSENARVKVPGVGLEREEK